MCPEVVSNKAEEENPHIRLCDKKVRRGRRIEGKKNGNVWRGRVQMRGEIMREDKKERRESERVCESERDKEEKKGDERE